MVDINSDIVNIKLGEYVKNYIQKLKHSYNVTLFFFFFFFFFTESVGA